ETQFRCHHPHGLWQENRLAPTGGQKLRQRRRCRERRSRRFRKGRAQGGLFVSRRKPHLPGVFSKAMHADRTANSADPCTALAIAYGWILRRPPPVARCSHRLIERKYENPVRQ